MEDNVMRDFPAAILMDPSSGQKRLSPNWLASALLYRRPEYATDELRIKVTAYAMRSLISGLQRPPF